MSSTSRSAALRSLSFVKMSKMNCELIQSNFIFACSVFVFESWTEKLQFSTVTNIFKICVLGFFTNLKL
jgi:hypothetical protein